MKRFKAITATLLILSLVFTSVTPAYAVTSPVEKTWTFTAAQLEAKNLSQGSIYWDDDLVAGHLNCIAIADGKYQVKLYEVFKISDASNLTEEQQAIKKAQVAFKSIRKAARKKGWWDCKWTITKKTKRKVTATAIVEYKSVKVGKNSKALTIKQVTKKNKKGKWKTTYKVGTKKYGAKQLKKLFNY